jgi:uncharacterized protein HemX
MSEPHAVPPPPPDVPPALPPAVATLDPSSPGATTLTAESAPPTAVRPRLSRGGWVFGALLVVLLAGLSVLAVVYVNNKRTADRVLGEQTSKIATLTEKTANQRETITNKERQISDSRENTDRLRTKNAGYEACKLSVQHLFDAGQNKDNAGVIAGFIAIAQDCKEVA